MSIFGNHDDEGSLPRANQMALIETLPYSLSKAGPENIDGVGNYVIEVLARGSSSHSALTLYLLDTHAYSPDERKYKGYDWIKQNQINWFRTTAEGLKRSHSEYTHMHMDVAFIHIPLPEYRNPELFFKGEWKEPPTAPIFNSNFRDALVQEGVVMVSCGQYVSPFLFSSLLHVVFILSNSLVTTSTSTALCPWTTRNTRSCGCAMAAVPASAATAATASSTARSGCSTLI